MKDLTNLKYYDNNGTEREAVPTSRTVNGKALSSDISLNKSDVGLSNVENVKQYSTNNPPPYPVTDVNGLTGSVGIHLWNVTMVATVNGSGSENWTAKCYVSQVMTSNGTFTPSASQQYVGAVYSDPTDDFEKRPSGVCVVSNNDGTWEMWIRMKRTSSTTEVIQTSGITWTKFSGVQII